VKLDLERRRANLPRPSYPEEPPIVARAGATDARLDDFRWRIEELRVSLYAQELKTPYPVSFKRLDKLWSQIRP
jgi:hypothetical protein